MLDVALTVKKLDVLSRVVILYLRNLLTHTVNNILQKLNYVLRNHHSVVKQKFSNIDIMCEIFRTIPWVLCNIQLIQFERVNIESH